ncbi:substrate-binding domain-containing protein [Streptomyces sp. NPDC050560]|uniref:substrate-binding domain-containing protein n=1 Tax=Streptomyces sp. NPDC050560 TaxID=3365630 RepID=UPI0037B74A8E
MQEHAPPRGGRYTLGLVTADIHLGVGAALWSGVLEAAERSGVNVVCFPGGEVRADGAPRAALYELVGPARLDGVISWTSTLGVSAVGEATAERFARRLRHLPVVSLNSVLDGHETLRCDSHAGMREAVGHLVAAHGRRRPACIRGPLANPVSLDRYHAYRNALARNRLPLDRSLVAAATEFADAAGAAAMRVLLDIRGLRPGYDFDALVACSDVLAAGALRLLAARGVRVPEDVSVVGFNDSMEARLSDPPLTSVSLPFAELGAQAVDTLVARLRGTAPPARSAVAGTLVTRRSCGCHSPLAAQSPPRTAAPGGGGREAGPVPLGAGFATMPRAGRQLAAAFGADLGARPGRQGAPPGGGFLPLLERVANGEVTGAESAAAWDAALLRARDALLPRLPLSGRAHAERLFGQARLLVAEKAHRLLEYERWAEQQDARRLRELGTALSTTVTTGELAAALARALPGTGVSGCRLVLYESDGGGGLGAAGAGFADGGPGGQDGGERPAFCARPARLVPLAAAGEAGTGPVYAPFPAGRLLPDEALPDGERFALVAEPLHIGAEHFGFALFDAGPRQEAPRRAARFRALGDQVSAALKGVRLFEEARGARDAAEQASRLKTRLLDNATDELRTPVEEILARAPRDPGAAADGAPGGVHAAAGRLLRLIDDLLDLSRSEIDALDLSWRLLDPRPVLLDAYAAATRAAGEHRLWQLDMPQRLPAVRADAARLRQILVTLMGAVAAHRAGGAPAVLSARVLLPVLCVRLTCPGLDVSARDADELFRPFGSTRAGMRLGPAIARRLAALHGGTVTLDTDGAGGPGFTLTLPLPAPAGPARQGADGRRAGGEVLLAAGRPPAEAAELARAHGLVLRTLTGGDETAAVPEGGGPPGALVWDAGGGPGEWAAVRRLHDASALRHSPFLLYGLAEPVPSADLGGALGALRPVGLGDPVLVVDGDAAARQKARELVNRLLPGRAVRTAADGTAALALLAHETPCLLIVARTLADMDGLDLVERIASPGGGPSPAVLLLADREHGLTPADVPRAEPHPGLVLLHRGVLTPRETEALLGAMARRAGPGRVLGSTPVRQALVYVEQHFRHPVSRWQVARAAGVSEDHLSRLFHRELGLTLWDYLTRLRVERAKERLLLTDDSVGTVGRAVGFHDRAYFSRVFRRVTGVAPHAYRRPG